MHIIRVFPRKTSLTPNDDLVFIGDPGLFLPPADEVHVSVAFTWDIPEGKRLQSAWAQYYPVVRIGGPAFGNVQDSFVPGKYIRAGVTFTTRGCNNHCPWCLVPTKEGQLIEIMNFSEGWIVQDNNLLQASRHHIERVFTMLRKQKRGAVFSGGLQASLVDDWFVELLRTIRLESVFLAADTNAHIRPLETALNKLAKFGRRKLRVYCMIGKDETIEQSRNRLQAIWDLGGLPFAQLYQPPERYIDYDSNWKSLVREWSRPAAMFATQKQANQSVNICQQDNILASPPNGARGAVRSSRKERGVMSDSHKPAEIITSLRSTELRTGADGAVAEESPNNLRTKDIDAGAMGDAG